MPAANKTQEQTQYTQASPVAGTPLPNDPTGLLFQAPDYSHVPVRRKKPVREEDHDDRSRDDRQRENTKRQQRNNRKQRDDRHDADQQDREADEDTREDNKRSTRGKRDAERHRPMDEDQPVSHRRRRRRRGNVDLEMDGGGEGDPEDTVTRVRAPRQASTSGPNEVTSLRGSTRLEAKRQRRRSTRRGRQRNTVVSEAEFLARRESVERKMLVRQHDTRIQIAVLEDGVFAEHFVSNTQQDSLIGNVYLGKVQNVLPSMEAAFVDIGRGRNAVLYAGEVNWDTAQLDGKAKKIENALKSGDSVLVQVTKDPVGHKGARLTSQISLPGRYLVYVPGGSMTGISRKLPDTERNRLKAILKENLPNKTGVIVRTAAEGISEEELLNDINRLRKQWEEIEAQSKSNKVLAPELLHSEPDLTIKVVRDVFNEDFTKMLVEGEAVWDKIQAYVTYVAPDLVDRLEQWDPKAFNGADLFGHYRIDEQLHKALDRKVNLPSGGSLVFDRTEAMTVVDVNTGKFTGSGGNLEETVTKNNLEAAEEIVRQLRLRDIGGIIVIDFIDMVLESNRDLVVRRLVECLGRDRSRHQVAEVTSLGLVQMTRKRMGTGLVEVFSHTCEHCAGRGIIVHDEPIERGKPYESSSSQRRRGGEAGTRRSRRRQSKDHQGDEQQQQPQQQDDGHHEKAEQTRNAIASIAAATTNKDNGDAQQDAANTKQRTADADESSHGSSRRRRRSDRGRSNRRADDTSQDTPRDEHHDQEKSAKQQPASDNADHSTGADGGQRSSRSSRKRRRAVAPQGSAGQTGGQSAKQSSSAAEQADKPKTQQQQAPQQSTAPHHEETQSQSAAKKRRRAASSATGATKIQQATDAPEPQGKTFATSVEDQPKKAEKPVKSSAILGVGVSAEDISSPGTAG